MMEEAQPDKAIADFLRSLPDTIKPNLITCIFWYAFDYPPSASKGRPDLEFLLDKYLLQPKGSSKVGAVLRSIGVIDQLLIRDIAVSRRNTTLFPEMMQTADFTEDLQAEVAKIVLRNPMTVRHAEAAQAQWAALKIDVLSPQNLMTFEDRQLSGRAAHKP